MSAGFEDSSLMLWPIIPIPASSSTAAAHHSRVLPDFSVSQFYLAGDNPDDIKLKYRLVKWWRSPCGINGCLLYTMTNRLNVNVDNEDFEFGLGDRADLVERFCYLGNMIGAGGSVEAATRASEVCLG